MKLLLDTHVLLWWLSSQRISARARAAIQDRDNDVLVSLASVWEIGIKKGIGKLDAPDDLEAQVASHSFVPLQITFTHAAAVANLPLLHRDPFDRMLVAQAQTEGLTVVTRDPRIARYGVPTLRA